MHGVGKRSIPLHKYGALRRQVTWAHLGPALASGAENPSGFVSLSNAAKTSTPATQRQAAGSHAGLWLMDT